MAHAHMFVVCGVRLCSSSVVCAVCAYFGRCCGVCFLLVFFLCGIDVFGSVLRTSLSTSESLSLSLSLSRHSRMGNAVTQASQESRVKSCASPLFYLNHLVV